MYWNNYTIYMDNIEDCVSGFLQWDFTVQYT
jgi:hypothetical protein